MDALIRVYNRIEMSETESDQTYECTIHKKHHNGKKRETFQQDLHAALLNASMYTSMMLYKRVNGLCHCPANYAEFDAIVSDNTEHKGCNRTTI
jgi:hypothetical protein